MGKDGQGRRHQSGLTLELEELCVPKTPSLLIKRPNRLTSAAMIALLCFFLTPFASLLATYGTQ